MMIPQANGLRNRWGRGENWPGEVPAYNFVLQHIDLGSRIEGIARQDYYELPVKTIREMISNAVCHRSYLTPGKIQVALFDDRLEVTSPGMLDSEITIEKMKSGLSKIRNRGIAAAFSYMNIVEAWGSGIPKMFREAKEYGLREPELIDMGSDFRINLYRKKAAIDQNGVIDLKERDTNDTKVEPNDTNEEAILSIILKNPQATQGAIAKEVEASLSTVKRIMRSLQKSGKLRREGTNRNGSWVVRPKGVSGMAEMNIKQIIDRLNAEFTGDTRKLVFWYDDNGEFVEDMQNVELENAKVYFLQADNQFATKLFLERQDTTTNYLIYAPFPKPDVRDNHLEDTLLYEQPRQRRFLQRTVQEPV